MTLKEARAILTPLGISLRKTEYGEYRINFKGGKEATAGYQTDLDDAVATGRDMAARKVHGIYGAYVFFLLHKGDVSCPVRKLTAWEKLLDGHNLYGRAVDTGLMPEAARVYLRLCESWSVFPEAVMVRMLNPLAPRTIGHVWLWPENIPNK